MITFFFTMLRTFRAIREKKTQFSLFSVKNAKIVQL